MPKKKVVAISLPRTISTALWKSMEANKHVVAFQEPGLKAYNINLRKLTNESTDFIDSMLKLLPNDFLTYESLVEYLGTLQNETDKHIFIKEMIFCAQAAGYMDAPFFDDAEFLFLVRRPENNLVSFYKESKQPLNDAMAPGLSYEGLFDFYQKMKLMNRNVHVVHSEGLIEQPEKTLRMICDKVGIEFDPAQLSWKPVPKETMHVSKGSSFLPGWHDTAKTSTHFDSTHIHDVDRDKDGNPTFSEIPAEFRQGYIDFWKKQLPFYEELCELSQDTKAKTRSNLRKIM